MGGRKKRGKMKSRYFYSYVIITWNDKVATFWVELGMGLSKVEGN